MIRLAALAPADLNLNGDQGNLLALSNYLRAAGFEVQVHNIVFGEPVEPAAFYLFGHGSLAAMEHLEPWLSQCLPELAKSQAPVLAVGSGALRLANHLGISSTAGLSRVSEFQVQAWNDYEVLGYRNTDTDAPNLHKHGNSYLTMFHGPVLAKNPRLLDDLAQAAVSASGEQWPPSEPATLTELKTSLNRICNAIWLLEAEKEVPGF